MSRYDPFQTGAAGGGLGRGQTNGFNPYAFNSQSNNDDSGSEPTSLRQGTRARERRAGGFTANPYGGFNPQEDSRPHVTRPTSLERSAAKRRSGQGGWQQRSPTRRGAQGQYSDTGHFEDVIGYIKRDWGFMTDETCVPIQAALQFMDDSSLGLAGRYSQFQMLDTQLQTGLKQIVNEQHQGFNSSIGRYHSIQSALQGSQHRIRTLKESLSGAKTGLSIAKPELLSLATSTQNYDDMLMTLSSIEQLQAVPQKLEARISEKRFLGAVDILHEALQLVRKTTMDDIGALAELRVYLTNQEHSLTDILIEELHSHLYLKSPYCENRWKQHASSHVRGIVRENVPLTGRQLYQFLDQLDADSVISDDPTRNPEADTFAYIQLLLEALHALGRLDVAVETIAHRLPVELFRIVEKSTAEVDQRYPAGMRTGGSFSDPIYSSDSGRSVILNDFFGTTFARFEAIAEGHRAVHEVISGITKREGTRGSKSLMGGFRELWKLFQSEIRSLLHDYLSTSEDAFKLRDDISRHANVFLKNPRDKTKKMFKLQDMDSKSSDLTTEREDLQSILTSSVPGLVSESKRTGLPESSSSNSLNDGSATGHRLLVDPSVFNMAILLPPSLTFLNRLKEVVPTGSEIPHNSLTIFLDDFLINVFLPQLDETLSEMCARVFIETDAFQQDSAWQNHASRPIFKGTRKFYGLIVAFCTMLDQLPHDQSFTQLVIAQIVTYYDKCYGWYKGTVARASEHPQTKKRVKMAAGLIEDSEFADLVDAIRKAQGNERLELIAKENPKLLGMLEGISIEETDLIMDRRTVASLSLLATSMKWLASKLQSMRFLSQQATLSESKRNSERWDKHQRRWTLITSQKLSEPDHVFIPLTEETAAAFDAAHNSYLQLFSNALRCLHVDLRCVIIHFTLKSMGGGATHGPGGTGRTFILDSHVNEPDPEVAELNAHLASADDELSTHLQAPHHEFIMTGLSSLLDDLIVAAASTPALVSAMNAFGCGRALLNVQVLQQNLVNIEPGASLRRSADFFDMFAEGPDKVIEAARKRGKDLGYTFGEMKALLTLCYSEALKSDRREVVVAAERGLEGHVLNLSEFLW